MFVCRADIIPIQDLFFKQRSIIWWWRVRKTDKKNKKNTEFAKCLGKKQTEKQTEKRDRKEDSDCGKIVITIHLEDSIEKLKDAESVDKDELYSEPYLGVEVYTGAAAQSFAFEGPCTREKTFLIKYI